MEVMYTDTYTVEYMDSVTLSSTKVSWNFFKPLQQIFFFRFGRISDYSKIIYSSSTYLVLRS